MKYVTITKSGRSGQPLSASMLDADLQDHNLASKKIEIEDKHSSLLDRIKFSYRLRKTISKNPSTFYIIHLNVESFLVQLTHNRNAIFVNHGIYNFAQRSSLLRLLNILVLLWSYHVKRNSVFLVSASQAKLLRIKNVIPNRINVDGLKKSRIIVGSSHKIKVAGFVGRCDFQKNLLVLKNVVKSHSNIKFLHLGPDKIGEFGEFKNYAHLPSNCREYFFNHIDLLLMPSRYESFGLVAYEAAFCGVPIVHSGQDGLSELDFGLNLKSASKRVWCGLDLTKLDIDDISTTWKDQLDFDRNQSVKAIKTIVKSFHHNADS